MQEDIAELLDRSTAAMDAILELPARRYRKGLEKAIDTAKLGMSLSEMIEVLRNDAAKAPTDDAKATLIRVFLRPYRQSLDVTDEGATFLPEDFVDFFMDIAEHAGVDLARLGKSLSPNLPSEWEVGVALRTVFETAGIYVEYPFACTSYHVPRKILVIVGAAVVGIATAKTATVDPVVAGAVGGVAALVLNILSSRYERCDDPEVSWIEEFILRVLQEHGVRSFNELRQITNIHPPLLKKTLADLRSNGLIEQHRNWLDKTDLRYDLSGRH